MNIEQLAQDAGVDWMNHPGLSREPVYVATQDELERFATLVRNEALEEAAVVCDTRGFSVDSSICAQAIRSMKSDTPNAEWSGGPERSGGASARTPG